MTYIITSPYIDFILPAGRRFIESGGGTGPDDATATWLKAVVLTPAPSWGEMRSVVPTLDSASPSPTWPLRVRARKPVRTAPIRTIRIGILGLGQVGQAVARLAADRAATAHAGLRFHVEQALVRDVEKARCCPAPGRITSNPSAFLRGNYEVVIEALGAVEPARSMVSRLLGRGTSVVTANKALVAAQPRPSSEAIAAAAARLRYEATACRRLPFLGTLAARRGRVRRAPAGDRQWHLQLRVAALAERRPRSNRHCRARRRSDMRS